MVGQLYYTIVLWVINTPWYCTEVLATPEQTAFGKENSNPLIALIVCSKLYVKPNPRFHGHTSHISPLLKSPSTALSDRNGEALCEYNALIKNNTWILVSKPPNVNVVWSMWLFRHKYHADGSLSSHVVKPTTIRMILSLALSRNWPIHQFDVKNVFLNGDLSDTVMHTRLVSRQVVVTRPCSYINMVLSATSCLHMHDSREAHLAALRGVLRYICGTLDFRLQLYASITGSLVAYTDADWAGFPTTRRSTSGYCVFLGDNILSCGQTYEIDIHIFCDIGCRCMVRVLHVPSRYQYADIFTKGLPSALFEEFRTSLSVQPSPAQTVGEC
ncbi:ribonuclease H-like domain-containing protein [Tanacetum coccineum]